MAADADSAAVDDEISALPSKNGIANSESAVLDWRRTGEVREVQVGTAPEEGEVFHLANGNKPMPEGAILSSEVYRKKGGGTARPAMAARSKGSLLKRTTARPISPAVVLIAGPIGLPTMSWRATANWRCPRWQMTKVRVRANPLPTRQLFPL